MSFLIFKKLSDIISSNITSFSLSPILSFSTPSLSSFSASFFFSSLSLSFSSLYIEYSNSVHFCYWFHCMLYALFKFLLCSHIYFYFLFFQKLFYTDAFFILLILFSKLTIFILNYCCIIFNFYFNFFMHFTSLVKVSKSLLYFVIYLIIVSIFEHCNHILFEIEMDNSNI